jgi:hypothetical protein
MGDCGIPRRADLPGVPRALVHCPGVYCRGALGRATHRETGTKAEDPLPSLPPIVLNWFIPRNFRNPLPSLPPIVLNWFIPRNFRIPFFVDFPITRPYNRYST